MLCGRFIENNRKRLDLKDVDGPAFGKTLDIWCGKQICSELGLGDVKELASVADRFQTTEVTSVLNHTIIEQLSIGMCVEVLSWSGEYGLRQSEVAAQKLALERFEELVRTESFVRIDERVLATLLDDEGLAAKNEEAVWEAVAAWTRAQEGQARGRGLVGLGKIRFPLMKEGYLRSRVVEMAPEEAAEWIKGVVAEALGAKAARRDGRGFEFELLGPTALDDRVGLCVMCELGTACE
jgi:hypothetical protein